MLVGDCTQNENRKCLRIGSEISEEDALRHKQGDILPPPQYRDKLHPLPIHAGGNAAARPALAAPGQALEAHGQ